jgi:hypothetical protein
VDSRGSGGLDFAASPANGEALLSQTNQAPELVAVVITADGRRVPVRFSDTVEVSVVSILRTIVLGLLALITGSRREPGGRRR